MTERNRSRQPAGVPVGGEYAREAGASTGVSLEDASEAESMTDRPTRQSEAPLQAVRGDTSKRTAREWVRLMQEGELDLDPPYQRGAVWTADQKIALVKSWCLGLPIPSVMTNDRWAVARSTQASHEGPAWAVVDGKQRLTAAFEWFNDKLAVPASWFPPESVHTVEDTPDGPYVRQSGLTADLRRQQGTDWTIPVAEAKIADVAGEAEVYLLLNGGGTAHTESDLARARTVVTAAELRREHEITQVSEARSGGRIVNSAQCSCGLPLPWPSAERQPAFEEHLINVARA